MPQTVPRLDYQLIRPQRINSRCGSHHIGVNWCCEQYISLSLSKQYLLEHMYVCMYVRCLLSLLLTVSVFFNNGIFIFIFWNRAGLIAPPPILVGPPPGFPPPPMGGPRFDREWLMHWFMQLSMSNIPYSLILVFLLLFIRWLIWLNKQCFSCCTRREERQPQD